MPDIVDELQLKIDAQVKKSSDIRDLTNNLAGLAKTVSRLSNMGNHIDSFGRSLSALSNVKLTKTIENLERLNSISLKNLNGKEVKLNIKVSGLNETERMKVAMEKTAADIRKITDEIANDIANVYNLKGQSKKDIQNIFADMGREIALDKDHIGGNAIASAFDYLVKSAKVSQSSFNESISAMKSEYQEFLSYLQNNKIKLTDSVDRKNYNQNTTRTERQNYFSQKNGTALDGRWNEIVDAFPTIMAGLRDVKNEEDQVYAVLDKIRESKNAIASQPLNVFDTNSQKAIRDDIYYAVEDGYKRAIEAVKSDLASNMASSAKQIPLDLNIDQNRFEQQIARAVETARKKDYGKIDVKLGVDTSSLKNEITTALSGANISDMKGVTSELKEMLTAMREMNGINPQESGLNTFINALIRLSKESANFNPQVFTTLTQSIQQLSGVAANAEVFGTFVSSMNTFIRNADKMTATANAFPALAMQLQEFFSTMSNVSISDNTVRMAEALTTLSQSGKRAGTAMQQVADGAKNTSASTPKATRALRALNTTAESLKRALTILLGVIKKWPSALQKHQAKWRKHSVRRLSAALVVLQIE